MDPFTSFRVTIIPSSLRSARPAGTLGACSPSPLRSSRCSPSWPSPSPKRATSSSSPSGTASARSSSAATTTSTSRAATSKPLDRYFPELHEALLERLPERLRGRRRDRDRHAARARLRRAAAAAAPRGVARGEAREGDAGVVRRLRSAGRRRHAICMAAPQRERRAALERLLRGRRAAGPPHADDARPRARPRDWLDAVRGRRPRRRDRQAGATRRTSPASAR